MDEQDNGRSGGQQPQADDTGPSDPTDGVSQERASNDGHWGEGAATAMERLRRHNYRVRRSRTNAEDKPTSE
jgi:hypothetical protein